MAKLLGKEQVMEEIVKNANGMAGDIVEEFERVEGDKADIAKKLSDMGLGGAGDNFDQIKTTVENIAENPDGVEITVPYGTTVPLSTGFHHDVSIKTAGETPEQFELDENHPDVEPNRDTQTIVPSWRDPEDESKGRFYGIKSVKVLPIPEIYGDATNADATVENVENGKKFITNEDGVAVERTGSMPVINHEADITLDADLTEYDIANGKHTGNGKVKIDIENPAAVDPAENQQTISAAAGKVMTEVVVNGIDGDHFINVDKLGETSASADDILAGKSAIIKNAEGKAEIVNGQMADKSGTYEFNPLAADSKAIETGYHNGSKVVLSGELLERLRAL